MGGEHSQQFSAIACKKSSWQKSCLLCPQLQALWTTQWNQSGASRAFSNEHIGYHNYQYTTFAQGTKPIRAKVVINCAGLYGDKIEALLTNAGGGRKITSSHTGSTTESALVEAIPPFSIAPRKGQFIVYRLADEDKNVLSSNVIVEPVATEFTKGVIIWKTLYGNVVVGPTATNVSSPEDYGSDIETLTTLQLFGENVLPCLKRAEVVGCYTGLRPATEHRDYQIYPAVGTNGARWITVGGIRSTGEFYRQFFNIVDDH